MNMYAYVRGDPVNRRDGGLPATAPGRSRRVVAARIGTALLPALASCLPIAEDTFEVDTGGAAARTASLTLCGETRPLERRGQLFVGVRRIDREGSGSIRVELERGAVECLVGYVAPGLDPVHWKFRVRGGRCEDVTFARP